MTVKVHFKFLDSITLSVNLLHYKMEIFHYGNSMPKMEDEIPELSIIPPPNEHKYLGSVEFNLFFLYF